jgi:RimJ/RimL family protein N-acetyltransferase
MMMMARSGMALDVPTLGDDVIALRLPTARDVDAITDACQDPDIPRFTRVPSPYTRADAVAFVERVGQEWHDGSAAVFTIADAANDRLLGSIGLMRLDDARLVAEIGYWVARDDRGRGIATRAVRLVSRWGAIELGIARIELMTRVENFTSQGVAAGAGYTREGLLRSYVTLGCGLADVVMFSLLPGDLPRSDAQNDAQGDLPGDFARDLLSE